MHENITRKLPVATFISHKQKCHFFSFFFYKIREQEGRTGLAGGGQGGGLVPVGAVVAGRWQGSGGGE
jgi:hypothetical protein